MNEKDLTTKLQQNIEIPDIVREKAGITLQQIRSGRAYKAMKTTNRTWRAAWVPIAAAVLAIGTTVCAAAYIQWSKGLETQLQVTEDQKQMLEEEQIAVPVNISVTENGITVTVLQTIVDSRFAYLVFKVDGYAVGDGMQPDFESCTFTIDGSDYYNLLMGHFFNGLQMGADKKFFYTDGSPAKEAANGSIIEKYMDENGSMEYMMLLMAPDENDSFIGKSLHLELRNLGTVYHAAFTHDIDAAWAFDFTLQGSDKVRSCRLSETLGDSGAAVIEAEISPISFHVTYDMPLQKTELDGIDAGSGQPIKTHTFVEAPRLTGARLKDGTLLTDLTGYGAEGYFSGNDERYQAVLPTRSIIEPDQVDALLFIKSYPEDGTPLTEENLYIVPVE